MATTTRHRSKDDRYTAPSANVKTWRGGPPPYLAIDQNIDGGHVIGDYRTFDDNVNPNFAKRVSEGEIVLSDMMSSRSYIGACPIIFRAGPFPNWYNGGYEDYSGDFGYLYRTKVSHTMPTLTFGNMSQVALIKAYAKMNRSDIMGGELVGDLDQTVSMLKRPFGKMAKALAKMATRKMALLRLGYTLAQATAQAWLEYRYGMLPLFIDAETIINEAERMRARCIKARYQVARATERDEVVHTQTVSVAAYGSVMFHGNVTESAKIRSSAGVIFREKPLTTQQKLRKLLGLRLSDVPTTAWELVPLSFVADWFVNVGDWLAAITPNPYVEVLGNWVTTVDEKREVYHAGRISYSWSGLTFTGEFPEHISLSVNVSRTCCVPLSWTPVWLGKPLSRLHCIDALSLSLEKLKGLVPSHR